jgi:hypothetical protein
MNTYCEIEYFADQSGVHLYYHNFLYREFMCLTGLLRKFVDTYYNYFSSQDIEEFLSQQVDLNQNMADILKKILEHAIEIRKVQYIICDNETGPGQILVVPPINQC